MRYYLYIYIYKIYVYCIYVTCMIYISSICMLKLLTLAAAHFHILAVHLFNAGLPCMASARALPASPTSCPLSFRPVTQVPPPTLKTQRSLWGRLCPCVQGSHNPRAKDGSGAVYVRTCRLFTREWARGGTWVVQVWNGMEKGLERNGPLQHSTATTQHIIIKIGSLERE